MLYLLIRLKLIFLLKQKKEACESPTHSEYEICVNASFYVCTENSTNELPERMQDRKKNFVQKTSFILRQYLLKFTETPMESARVPLYLSL